MDSALSALRGASQHGTSSSVVISGPAGIGKTALLAEICEHATRMKIRIGRSKCDPIEQIWPGAPVIAALRSGQDPLTTAEQYEQIARVISEPLLLADRIACRLEDLAAVHPLLVAIDDLQWADQVSRFLLRSLLSRLAGLPVVWMFASRDDPIGIDLARHPTRVSSACAADHAGRGGDGPGPARAGPGREHPPLPACHRRQPLPGHSGHRQPGALGRRQGTRHRGR
jgi:hypothetical protein